MSICNVKQNTVKSLISKGAMNEAYTVLDYSLFRQLNEQYSELARNKYKVQNADLLFTVQNKVVPRLGNTPYYREDTKLVSKAIPNEEMFDELQANHDAFHAGGGIFYQTKEESKPMDAGRDSDFNSKLIAFFNKNGFEIRTDVLNSHFQFFDFKSGIDLIQKQVFLPNEDFVPTREAAVLALTLLKKTKEFLSLSKNIKAWDEFESRKEAYIQELKSKHRMYGTDLYNTAEMYVMYDFVEKYVLPNYDEFLKADKTYKQDSFYDKMKKKYPKSEILKFIDKVIKEFKNLLKKIGLLKASFQDAEDSARRIASEILNNTINFSINENYELKQTLELSQEHNDIKVELANKGLILTGSAKLRLLGDIYRPKDEVIKDLDFIMTYDDFLKFGIDVSKMPEKEYVKTISDKVSEMMGSDYKLDDVFIGNEHKGNKALTLKYIKNGIPIDIFVRTNKMYANEFANDERIITDMLTNKLLMAKDKHITDYLYFKPKTQIELARRSPSVQILSRLALDDNFNLKKERFLEFMNLQKKFKDFENDEFYNIPHDEFLTKQNQELLTKIENTLGKRYADTIKSLIENRFKKNPTEKGVKIKYVIKGIIPAAIKSGIISDINFVDEKVDQGLDDFLKDWAAKYNIDVQNIAQFADSQNISLSGAVDVINKIIYLAKSDDRNVTTMAEECATMMLYMLGTEHKDVKYALSLLRYYPSYDKEYLKYSSLERYRETLPNGTTRPNKAKIDVEILSKALAERIVIKYKARQKDSNPLWKAVEGIIQTIIDLFKSLNYVNLDVLLNRFATDMLSGKESRLIQKLPETYELTTYEKTIEENPQLVEILEALNPLGFYATGSLSYRNQLDTYRAKGEKIHDLDLMNTTFDNIESAIEAVKNALPGFWITNGVNPLTKQDGLKIWEGDGSYNATGYYGGKLIGKIGVDFEIATDVTGKEIKHAVQKIGSDEIIYETGRDAEGNVYGDGVLVDLFIQKNKNMDIVADNYGLAHYIYSYDEKLKYGRPKDALDLVYAKNRRNVPVMDNKFVFYQTKGADDAVSNDMKQIPGTEISAASPKVIKLVKEFLKNIGVNINTVKKIKTSDGRYLNDNGIAELTRKLIQIVEGKEDVALTEEAMHFAVEILEQTNPKLFNKLLSEIGKYKIYSEVFAVYSQDADYQTSDGKPDIRKIKKEAIGKLLAETVIKKAEEMSDNETLTNQSKGFWKSIVEWFKNLFARSGFDKAANLILSGKNIGTADDIKAAEGEIMKQKSAQDTLYDTIKSRAASIENKNDKYYIGDKEIPMRVSNLVDAWYERRFRSKELIKSDYQKAVDDQRKEKGTAGHKDFEYAFTRFVDDDGYLRSTYLGDDDYESKLNKYNRDMYETLRDNLRARLESFPKGTRFLKEATIYNGKSLAGTIDFMAITPDAKISILDWKFIDIDVSKSKADVPWYKVGSWNLQMENYKNILKVGYGIKEEQFQQTRMIPIRAEYVPGSSKQNRLPILVDVQIGDVDVKKINETYLIPVGIETERTGNKKIDELLSKLNAVYRKLSEQKALPSQKREKSEQLNALFSAIRHLQMKQDVIPLLEQAQLLNKQLQNVINTYTSKFEGQDPKSFTEEEVSSFAADLLNANDAISVYSNLNGYLRFLYQSDKELTENEKKLKELINDVSSEAKDIEITLAEKTEAFVDNIIAGSEDVKGILSAEKVIKGITKLFSSTSTIQIKAMEVLYKKANKAFAYAGMDTLDETKRLQEIKKEYDDWARSKGLSPKSYFDIIKKKDANELIDEFKPEFYSELRKKIQDKNFEWVKDNIDLAQFKQFMKEKLEEEFKRIEEKNRIGTDVEIANKIKSEKADAAKLFDTTTTTSPGWFQYDLVKKFPNRTKWESSEWKELTAKGNEPAKKFYDYIIERNEYYNDIGYINARQARVFLPYVRRGLVEKLIFGGNVSIGEQFMRNISIDEGDVGYGKTDPITGKPIDTVPIYFTKEIDGEVSTDLFRTMALYNEMAIKYKYISDIEDQVRAIVRVEKNKKAIKTSYFGKTQYKSDGSIDESPDNSENAKLVEDMMKAIIYGQKYIQSDSFDIVLGKLGNLGEKINKKLGRKIFPENIDERQLSVNKVVTQLNNTFQMITLGINTLSATSNLFGGTAQSIINAGKYFTKTDYISTEAWLLMSKMNGDNAKLKIAALQYFLPLTENYNKEIAKTLSLSNLSEERIQEFLMILMRKTDLHVQTVNFFSYLNNTIVENGEVVNARELLRKTDKYKDRYAGTVEERKRLDDEFEEDVKKLVEEKGVLKLGKVENGEFTIPGVERKSKSVVKLRRTVQSLSKDALGNLSEDDQRKINMTVYGKSFMIFKNWIPRLADVRFGNIKYNSASDAYEWGRMRTVYRVISEDLLGSLGNLRNSLLGNEKGVEFLRELFEKKREEYKRDTNKDLEMTETEFMDLVRSNVKNQLYDTIFLLTLFAILVALKAYEPDDKEDPAVRNQYKYLLRMVDKMKDELTYFYDPTSITNLVSQGIFPSMSLIENFGKILKNFMIENYALAIGDEELQKKTYVLKYVMKSFPLSSQASGFLPMFYPEMAKDLGIRMQSRSGFR